MLYKDRRLVTTCNLGNSWPPEKPLGSTGQAFSWVLLRPERETLPLSGVRKKGSECLGPDPCKQPRKWKRWMTALKITPSSHGLVWTCKRPATIKWAPKWEPCVGRPELSSLHEGVSSKVAQHFVRPKLSSLNKWRAPSWGHDIFPTEMADSLLVLE